MKVIKYFIDKFSMIPAILVILIFIILFTLVPSLVLYVVYLDIEKRPVYIRSKTYIRDRILLGILALIICIVNILSWMAVYKFL